MIFKIPSNHSKICVSMEMVRPALDGKFPCHAPESGAPLDLHCPALRAVL